MLQGVGLWNSLRRTLNFIAQVRGPTASSSWRGLVLHGLVPGSKAVECDSELASEVGQQRGRCVFTEALGQRDGHSLDHAGC